MTTFPLRARRSFDADPASVALARRFARQQLEEWGAPELQDGAALAISELVTNALVHAGTTATVDLRLDARCLRIEVEDQHPGRVLQTDRAGPGEDSESGRGLLVSAAMASAWGVEYTASSKRIWLLLDRDHAVGPAPGPLVPRRRGAAGTAIAVVELGADGAVTEWHADATRLLGWTPDAVLGRPYVDLVEPEPGRRPPEAAGPPTRAWQGEYSVLADDGSAVPVFASHRATRDGATIVLLVAEEQRSLLEHPVVRGRAGGPSSPSDPLGLRDDALVRLSVDEYLPLATERVRAALDADAAVLLISQEDTFEVAAVSGLPDDLRGTRVPADEPGLPSTRSPRMPVVVPDGANTMMGLLRGTSMRSLAAVPVFAEGRLTGALAVASEGRDVFSEEQYMFLQRLADSLALPADRARLQTSDRERRGWLTFVAEAGDLLAHSLDQEMTMAITGQIVVPRLATWCAVYLDDEREAPVLQQVWHQDERAVEGLRSVLGKHRPDELPTAADTQLEGEVDTLRLLARGRGIGHLLLGRPAGSPLRDDVRLVTESIVRRAALAIDNARTHGALLAIGQTLQAGLLPPSLPDVPGLDLGVVYEAAGEGTAGGDFYDIFPIGGGSWCFVVGDVCGTGAEAAAVTGLARHTIRSLTRAGFSMAATLERLNDAILEEGERARFLTLVGGTFRRQGSRVHLSAVNAGHPPLFVVGTDHVVRRLGSSQLLLGVSDRVTYVAEDHVLEPGELMVALTDGVLERRNGERMLDDAGVAADLARAGELPAQAIAERLRRLAVDFADSPQSDDIAILALRVGW